MSAAIKERGNWKLRALDRYVGIPMVLLLGLFRKKSPAPPANPESFGFLITTAIGDAILNSAAIARIREAFPGARLTGFCSSGNQSIVRMMEGLDEVIDIPVTHPVQAVKKIRAAGPLDVWIDFGPWPRINAILSGLSGARFKIGFSGRGQFRHYAYDLPVKHSLGRHEVDNYLALLEPLGISPSGRPRIRVPEPSGKSRAAVLHIFPGGSRHYLKSWPEDNWVQLIDSLVANGYEIHLTGSPADRAKLEPLLARCSSLRGVHLDAGMLTLSETGTLIRRCDVTVSVDTGILHLASALGANLVALHGPTSPARWGALNANAISLSAGLPCSPCISIGYEKGCGVNACMRAIPPGRVLKAIEDLVGEGATRAIRAGAGTSGGTHG